MLVVTHIIDEHTNCNILLNSSSYISWISIMCKCLKKNISLKWLFSLTMMWSHMYITCVFVFCWQEDVIALQPKIFNLQFDWSSWTISFSPFTSLNYFSPFPQLWKVSLLNPPSFNRYWSLKIHVTCWIICLYFLTLKNSVNTLFIL